MNIYKLTRSDNYGTCCYEEAVVFAPDRETARTMYPGGKLPPHHNLLWTWTFPEFVKVRLLGVATSTAKAGVISAILTAE